MQARSLSARESQVILSLEANDQDVVTIDDITTLVDTSRTHARKLAHDLHEKRWLQRIGHGEYLLIPAKNGPDPIPETNPYRIGKHLIDPYAFAYATAANHHDLTTQTPQTYTIATTTRTEKQLNDPIPFRIIPIIPRKFFGHQQAQRYGTPFHVTDLEKTILDCLDRPDLAGGIQGVVEIITEAKPRINPDRLADYATRFENKSLAQRLGYLLETVRPELEPDQDLIETLQRLRTKTPVPLASPTQYGTNGETDHRWLITLNLPEPELFGEVTPH